MVIMASTTSDSTVTQRKQVCYFDTQECAKQMSPVSAHYTCAVVKRVLN